ncbi:MAG: N-acetylneuraminate synthase [Parcubacteria group bacterium Gr01-1014_66]|nr:MAG: N-acetylneuraminate synthase [Parcubacteria group bacterium Gr01-1014_66]
MFGHSFNFENLFIFELANNHNGLLEHGVKIINEMADIVQRKKIRGAIKLQFRDLDTFIHPAYRENKENKHITRFLSTRMSEEQFTQLVEETRRRGLVTICTPFDESSVDKIERLGIEVIKIGSCSAQDWPLLERIAETGKPVICSTGGLTLKEIDRIVSFFQHRGVHFALMHCVAVYPTPNDQLSLNQIVLMRNRYPALTIGFSTHEEPDNLNAVRVAYAKGARIFEKHVGVSTDTISLNTYSATPAQVEAWIGAYLDARDSCGAAHQRTISQKETDDLVSLMRGVYAKKEIKKGAKILRGDVFFAMPLVENQLFSGHWRKGMVADQDYARDVPINASLHNGYRTKKDIIYSTIHTVKGMLNEARIPLGHEFSVELSHHYGIERFDKIGCTIIECISREYAKKIMVQLPDQWNPTHYHKQKDESFHVLAGEVEVEIEGQKKKLTPGDTLWIPCGVWHAFGTHTGAIIEEISTADSPGDSFYIDRNIARMPRDARKTYLRNWGRHQFDDLEEQESTDLLAPSFV